MTFSSYLFAIFIATTVSILGQCQAEPFSKISLKHCWDSKYGNYPTLDAAKGGCRTDSNCQAVYDGSCDGKAPFYLCPNGITFQKSGSSCVYVKLAGNLGEILIVPGYRGHFKFPNPVTLFDVEDNTKCELPALPKDLYQSAGGLIATQEGSSPLICGGTYDDKFSKDCYLLFKCQRQWIEVHSLPKGTTSMTAVSVDSHWILFSGGQTERHGQGALRETFLLNSLGQKVSLPNLNVPRWGSCSAVLDSNETTTVVAILGGYGPGGAQRSMERYSCSKGDIPDCIKLPNGPENIQGRFVFGCGSLQTSQGGRVLLALTNNFKGHCGSQCTSEILDLSNEANTWKKLNANMPQEQGFTDSFVTSIADPTTGIFMPIDKSYFYQVRCDNAESCSFTKTESVYTNTVYSVTMAIPEDAGLTCN